MSSSSSKEEACEATLRPSSGGALQVCEPQKRAKAPAGQQDEQAWSSRTQFLEQPYAGPKVVNLRAFSDPLGVTSEDELQTLQAPKTRGGEDEAEAKGGEAKGGEAKGHGPGASSK